MKVVSDFFRLRLSLRPAQRVSWWLQTFVVLILFLPQMFGSLAETGSMDATPMRVIAAVHAALMASYTVPLLLGRRSQQRLPGARTTVFRLLVVEVALYSAFLAASWANALAGGGMLPHGFGIRFAVFGLMGAFFPIVGAMADKHQLLLLGFLFLIGLGIVLFRPPVGLEWLIRQSTVVVHAFVPAILLIFGVRDNRTLFGKITRVHNEQRGYSSAKIPPIHLLGTHEKFSALSSLFPQNNPSFSFWFHALISLGVMLLGLLAWRDGMSVSEGGYGFAVICSLPVIAFSAIPREVVMPGLLGSPRKLWAMQHVRWRGRCWCGWLLALATCLLLGEIHSWITIGDAYSGMALLQEAFAPVGVLMLLLGCMRSIRYFCFHAIQLRLPEPAPLCGGLFNPGIAVQFLGRRSTWNPYWAFFAALILVLAPLSGLEYLGFSSIRNHVIQILPSSVEGLLFLGFLLLGIAPGCGASACNTVPSSNATLYEKTAFHQSFLPLCALCALCG
jgi:hypothetical protein